MKKIIFILTILLLPVVVYAKEDSGLPGKLDQVLGGQHKLVVNTKTLKSNYLLNMPDSSEESTGPDGYSRFINSYLNNLPEVVNLLNEYRDDQPVIDVYCISKTQCGIKVEYKSDARGTCTIEQYEQEVAHGYQYPACYYTDYTVELKNIVNDPDINAYNAIKKIYYDEMLAGFPTKNYYLYDLSYINQLYNRNNGEAAFVTGIDLKTYFMEISKRFPEINDITKGYPDYKVEYAKISAAGIDNSASDVVYAYSADYIVYYKNTAYLTATFFFNSAPIIFVDEDTPDDKLMEAAKKRIDDYLNDSKVKVVIDDITPTFDDTRLNKIYTELDEYLAAIGLTTRHDANTRVYSLKIGATESPKNLYIIKTNKSNIKALEIKAIEKNTGIRLTSTSSLSMDSILEAVEVTEAYKKLNAKVAKAYNINLFSSSKNTYIKSVAGGMKIYIPVENNFVSEGKVIAYLNDKGEVQEKFTFTVETIDNQKYIAFVTDHLSVYGIVEENNPNTADSLMIILAILIVATIILVIAVKTKTKRYE